MNTLCLYVFWNLHEQKPGVFDFKGNKDVARFCRIAQKEGMYVILRPGPYVCAEWEMGGLPWWLLKNDSVKLRTLDPYYMQRVSLFMEEIGKQLAGLQITRGGNIIMVQVENEYGSYGVDKPYISAIRDIVRKAGFTDVPLFQCDWSSNFTLNGLDDLLWTVNFGTGSDINNQFERLKKLRPDSPLMCSEYWSGWFDHWGRKHETRDGGVMVSGLKEMIDKNISFSLYMTHGGTTFGHWGGANNPSFSAMCTSYDYDAPISEAGWITLKYIALRNMLKNSLPQGMPMLEIPKEIPTMEIPPIVFHHVSELFDQLPQAHHSENVKPMEKFDQGWGTILYRTNLPKISKGTILKITEQHDWTQVFLDGKKIATLDRRKNEQSVAIPALSEGTRLDLLVEAMGRVNFDKSIHDRKGITEKVELIDAAGKAEELKGWSIFNFPLDYPFTSHRIFKDEAETSAPAYYKATFYLNKTADTFLDMSTWGKGMVWVNGHELGRFWEIGPQQTLYMPGCWLKKGQNEIIVLDLKGPSKAIISGLKRPILDLLREKTPTTHRGTKEKINLSGLSPIVEGCLKDVKGWQEVHFGKGVSGRYFCFEALSSFDLSNIASVAELELLDANGQLVPRNQWSVRYADSEETRSGNYTADKVYDLQESTCWQTVDNVSYPHHIVIDLGKERKISGMKILSSPAAKRKGAIKTYRVFLKDTDFYY
jgi:beta-galactosidase